MSTSDKSRPQIAKGPFSANEIKEVIEREDDFAHELKVGAVLRDFPLVHLSHGGTYQDPTTGKPRQFDFRCSLAKGDTRIHLAVECKNLDPTSPVVVVGIDREKREAFYDLIVSAFGTRVRPGSIIDGQHSFTKRVGAPNDFYPLGQFVGKSVLRIQRDKDKGTPMRKPDSDIYERWAQALSSASDLSHGACRLAHSSAKSEIVSLVLPVVVVPDGSLWIINYRQSGQLENEPTNVDSCSYFVGQTMKLGISPIAHEFQFSHIHFFTVAGLRAFLRERTTNSFAWDDLFTAHAAEI